LLVNDAVFSFGFALRSQGVTNRIVSIFNETILKLCTDMSARMRASFFQILQEVAESSVQVRAVPYRAVSRRVVFTVCTCVVHACRTL
jgi:hypothetical protein